MNIKKIDGFENYFVSEDGKVYSNKLKFGWKSDKLIELKQNVNKSGYYYVNLCKNGKARYFYVHRLVAMSYIKNPNNKKEVNHIDGNKSNNSANNLEWVTHKENMHHAFDVLNIRTKLNEGKNRHKIICVETKDVFNNQSEAANLFLTCRQTISRALKNGGKCKGFHFKYLN